MKRITFFIIIAIAMLMFSCKDDKLVEPEIDYSNADLATQLAHYKFGDSQYYLQFFPDGTFIQRQLTDRANNGLFVNLYERTGKYKLEDNLIKLSDIKVNYNSSLGGISIIWADQEVSLVDGRITFKSVAVLVAQENKNELWNYWKTIKWVFHHIVESNESYTGREEYYYEFVQTDPKVRYGWNYLDGIPWQPVEFKSNYTFTPPDLYMQGPAERYSVEFKNNKMYWYYKPLLNKSSITSVSARPLFPESITYK
jgi:hypothetical protein